jgi:hypothetical protein
LRNVAGSISRMPPLLAVHVQDFPEDVGETVRAIQARQHPQGAADLHLLEEQ